MTAAPDITISACEDRYTRFTAIPWWDQERLRSARVLVVGAGALGNEVIKNLALLGVGHLAIIDMDRIELSNLSRSILYRASDEGALKAATAARAARAICPDCEAIAIQGNLLADAGLGWIRWAEIVVGALDNREARVFLNRECARLGRPWFDGGIEALAGVVRGFDPPRTACYECTMSALDWSILAQRRSCSMLARQALASRGVPTTPTSAAVIGGIQAQEVLKRLHGLECLLGSGFFFEGAAHSSYRIEYRINPDCPWHEGPLEVVQLAWCGVSTPLVDLMDHARGLLGGLDAIDSPRELVELMECPRCATREPCWQPLEALSASAVLCPVCRQERILHALHSFTPGSPHQARTLGEMGLPPFDILTARCKDRSLALERSADGPAAATTPAKPTI